MDRFRYVIAIFVLLTIPLAVAYWFTIHPFIRFWRRQGLILTYMVVTIASTAVVIGTYFIRSKLLGADFGMNWLLFGVGAVCFAVSMWVDLKARQLLSNRTLVGVPEIKSERDPGILLTGGMYSKVRHPRYLAVLLTLLGWTLMANYSGVYLMFVLFVLALYAIILLEERELTERFGDQYREYCRRTPRLIPRLGKQHR